MDTNRGYVGHLSDYSSRVAPEQDTPTYTGRAFDRIVNFSDAVVAVAITVLVLPIADIPIQRSEQTVWEVLSDNSGLIITFFFTFAVVGAFWWTHNRIFNQLAGFDVTLLGLNLGWIASVAFLPVSSYLYGAADSQGNHGWSESGTLGGAGLLYWGSLALVSLWSSLMSWHIRRNPVLVDQSLQDPPVLSNDWRKRFRGAVFTGYFVVTALVSVPFPALSVWMPIGLIFVGRVMK